MATRAWQVTGATAAERRRNVRRPAVGLARIADGDGTADAMLLDVSVYGCRLAVPAPRQAGERLWIRLEGSGPAAATVVWADGKLIGCRFDKPIARTLMRELTRALH